MLSVGNDAKAHDGHSDFVREQYAALWAEAGALRDDGHLGSAVHMYRKAIALCPRLPDAYAGLGAALARAGFLPGAAAACMHAMDRQVSGSREWAISAASAFDCLRREECRATSYPHWWSDEGIKALSARVLVAIPNGDFYRTDALEMRGRVLSGREAGWEAAERTPAELREASGCFGAAAAVEPSPEASDAFRALASRSAVDEAGAAREALLRRRQHYDVPGYELMFLWLNAMLRGSLAPEAPWPGTVLLLAGDEKGERSCLLKEFLADVRAPIEAALLKQGAPAQWVVLHTRRGLASCRIAVAGSTVLHRARGCAPVAVGRGVGVASSSGCRREPVGRARDRGTPGLPRTGEGSCVNGAQGSRDGDVAEG